MCLQPSNQIGTGDGEGRQQAECHTRRCGNEEGEGRDAGVGRQLHRQSEERRRRHHASQQLDEGVGRGQASGAAGDGQQNAFGHQLPDQAAAPDSQRKTKSQFVTPRARPRQHEAGKIGAGERENQRGDRTEEHHDQRSLLGRIRRHAVGPDEAHSARDALTIRLTISVRVVELPRRGVERGLGGPHVHAGSESEEDPEHR